MQQKIQNRQFTLLTGLLLVLGIVVFLFALSFATAAVQLYVDSTLGMLLFWGIGGLVVWLLLYQVVMAYQYTWNGMVLRIERVYGKRARFAGDIALRHLNGIGTLAEMRAKFPKAKISRATRRQCPIPELAVAYTDSEGQRIYVIQPNEELRAKLLEALKAK